MKKIMFAAVAALAITSCSQSEDFDAPGSKSEINFNTAVTRGTVLVTADFKQFKAYGYAHAEEAFTGIADKSELMNGTFNVGTPSWTEAENQKFYWPLTGKVAFFGYSPISADAVYTATAPGFPKVAYTVNTVIADQADFVVAALPNQVKATSVALPFNHALTQVVFKLKGNDATVNYSVTKIVLKGIKNAGTYDFGTESWDASADETSVDYTIDLTSTPKEFKGEASTTALEANDQLLILMPQALSGASVEVTYSAKKGETLLFNSTHKANLSTTWAVGEKNIYTLVLQAGDEIKLTGTVDTTWTDKVITDTPVTEDLP